MEEEHTIIDVDSAAVKDVEKWLDQSFVGKILLKRNISGEVLQKVLKVAWRVGGELGVEVLGRNIFLFRFENVAIRNRVMREGSWFFDKALIVMETPTSTMNLSAMDSKHASFWVHFCELPLRCMNVSMSEWFDNAIGRFEHVDYSIDKLCWGGV